MIRSIGGPVNDAVLIQVGDVITLGAHWSVPRELQDKMYFRVQSVAHDAAGQITGFALSLPYVNSACTRRYHPPRRR